MFENTMPPWRLNVVPGGGVIGVKFIRFGIDVAAGKAEVDAAEVDVVAAPADVAAAEADVAAVLDTIVDLLELALGADIGGDD